MNGIDSTVRQSIETALAAGKAPRVRYIRPLRQAEEAVVIGVDSTGVFYRDRAGRRHHVMWSSVTDVVAA